MKLGSCGRFGAPFVSGLVVLAGLLFVPAAPAWAEGQDGPPRILVVGDSISRGYASDFTWRYRLAKYFGDANYGFDLVGSKSGVINGTANYMVPGFDSDHFAYAGWTYANVTDGAESLLTAEVRAQLPDVVILELGSNDMAKIGSPARLTAAATITGMKAAVAQIRAVKDTTAIVVANVPGRLDSPTYSKRLAEAVTGLKRDEAPIVIADLNSKWVLKDFTYDNTHLTPVGETFEAQKIAEALAALGVGPAGSTRPAIFDPSLTWRPRLTPGHTFSRDGSRARISWDGKLVTAWNVDVTYRLVNTNRTTVVRVAVKNIAKPSWATPRLIPGATYDVHLRPIRGRMTAARHGPKDVFVAPGPTLAAVRNLKAKAVARSVKLTWSKKAGATGYRVFMRSYTASDKPGTWVRVKSNTKATSLTVAVSSSGKKYEFQVRPLKYYKKGLGANVSVRTKSR